jgi:hypothetical protein
MTELILINIAYLILCLTVPYVCITVAFTSTNRLSKVSAIAALVSFFYISIFHVLLS